MNRLVRGVVVGLSATLAAVSLAACGSSSGSSGSKQIRVYASGDVNVKDLWNKTIIPGFTKANPGYTVKLTFSEHSTADTTTLQRLGAAVKTKRDSGYDVFDAGFVASAGTNGLFATTGSSQVPNLKNTPPNLSTPVEGKAAPYRGTTVALAYNSDLVKTPPKTLDQLLAWIKAHPGMFTYNSPTTGGSGGGFVETVLDRYVPVDVQKKMTTSYDKAGEKYWTQGLSVLAGLKSDIYQHVYPNGNDAVLQLLGKQTIDVCPVWVDQALTAQSTGILPKSIKLTQISDPSFTGGAAYLGVPANDKRTAAAFKLINYVLEPGTQAEIVKVMSGFPAINLSQLPVGLRSKFGNMSNAHFRQGYQTDVTNDMNQAWQKKVA